MRLTPLFLAAGLALGLGVELRAEGEDGAAPTGAVIEAKAFELAPTNALPAERVIALHRFVREEIRQIPSEYG